MIARRTLKRRNPSVKLFDVVVLLTDQPRYHLRRGDLGTVIRICKTGAYEVEFSDETGQTQAQLALSPGEFLVVSKQGEHCWNWLPDAALAEVPDVELSTPRHKYFDAVQQRLDTVADYWSSSVSTGSHCQTPAALSDSKSSSAAPASMAVKWPARRWRWMTAWNSTRASSQAVSPGAAYAGRGPQPTRGWSAL